MAAAVDVVSYRRQELIDVAKSELVYAHADFIGHAMRCCIIGKLAALPADDECKMGLEKYVPVFDDLHLRLRSGIAATDAEMQDIATMMAWSESRLYLHSNHPQTSVIIQLRLALLAMIALAKLLSPSV